MSDNEPSIVPDQCPSRRVGGTTTSPIRALLVPVIIVAAAAGIRLACLQSLGTGLTFIIFCPAVMLAALYGGMIAGVLATALSAALADYFWIAPTNSFIIAQFADWLGLVIFVASGTIISWITGSMRRAQQDTARAELEAHRTSERARVTSILLESEDRFRALAAATFEGIAITEAGRYVDVNDQWLQMLGYSREELIGTELVAYLAPEDRDRVLRNTHAGIESRIEQTVIRKDGTRLVVEAHGRTVDYHNRKVRFTAIRDVTQQKQAQDQARQLLNAVREEKDRLSALINSISDEVWFADTQGRFTLANASALREFGILSGDKVPIDRLAASLEVFRSDGSRRPPEEAPPLRALRGETISNMEEVVKSPTTGQMRHRQVSSSPVRNPAGAIVGSVSIVRDITDHKRLEDAQSFLAKASAATSGEDFFQALARFLAQNLSMDYVCIDRLEGGLLAAQTVAIYFDGKFEDNVSYTLKDTPCGDVVGRTICCFPEKVRHRFPSDTVLQEMRAESYLGTTLWNSRGQPIGLIAVIGRQPMKDPKSATSVLQLVAVRAAGELERRQADEATHRLNRTLKALASSSQAMSRAANERQYTAEVCRIVVEDCGHAMVWIGYAQDDPAKSVRPVAWSGLEAGYLESLHTTWADTELGRGPTGAAVRTGRPAICRNMRSDPLFAPWRDEAIKRGYASAIALPLHAHGKTFGALTVYCSEPDPFVSEEVHLLNELVGDLAHGIVAIRLREAHEMALISLRQSEERYRSLFSTLLEGFCIIEMLFDAGNHPVDFRFLEINPAFSMQTGLHNAQGKRMRELAPEYEAHWFEAYGNVALTGRPTRFINHAEALNRWFDVSAYRVGGSESRRVAILFSDITERKRAEDDLKAARVSAEQAKATAEAANKAKDHFLAVLSHELRNPLNPVLATAAMLRRDDRFDADTQEQLEVIHRNAELEARLIDDLLDVTRIERGKVELNRQPIELGTIIRRAVEVCRPDIEARQLEFGIDMGKRSYLVYADAARLQQVFWNLIKNAVKFTPFGGRVGVRCSLDSGGSAAIDVWDSGEGIEPEALYRIFNAFEQAERSITRQFGGLGLGLAISKGLVEMHGGTIEARSEGKGKGATFTVRLPLIPGEAASETTAPSLPTRPPTSPIRSLRILLVEDHGDSARIMARLLSGDGHQVQTAADVATATRLACEAPYDLLLSDLGLPDGSGLDLMRGLRAKGINLPGIALSGYGLEADIQASREAGFTAHLTKPVVLHRLQETIHNVVSANG